MSSIRAMVSIPTAQLQLLVNQMMYSTTQLGAGLPVSNALSTLRQPVEYAMSDEVLARPLQPLHSILEQAATPGTADIARDQAVDALKEAVAGLRPLSSTFDENTARILEYMHSRWDQLTRLEGPSPLRNHPLLADAPADTRPFSLHSLLSEGALLELTRSEAELELNLMNRPKHVMGPKTRVQQIIMNLVTDALDAMKTSSKKVLRISTEQVFVSEAQLTDWKVRSLFPAAVPGTYVRLRVGDTGMRNQGLGLRAARDFVMHQSGFIAVQPPVEPGTTVDVFLPAAMRRTSSTQLLAIKDSLDSPGNDVLLIVDNNEETRHELIRILQQYKYDQILEASTGSEALAIIRKRDDITALLTDMVMPGMSGRKLIIKIKQQQPSLPIIAMSRHRDTMRHLGSSVGIFHKPLTDHAVLARLLRDLIEAAQSDE